jgi:hypothetical protein
METLEEATKKYANKNGDIPTTELEDAIFKQGFIDGAKWQQERSYSEEEVIKFGQWLSEFNNLDNESEYVIKQLLERFKNK